MNKASRRKTMNTRLLHAVAAVTLAAVLSVGGCANGCENPLASDREPDTSTDSTGFSFEESVIIEFTIGNWSYGDYSSVLEVKFVRGDQVLFSHDVGIENAVEDEGWVFSYGYVFAYAAEEGSFTLLDVPPLTDVTEIRIIIDDWTNGTFNYQFFSESLEGRNFAVSASQGNEIFVLTPDS